jgi:hypothetical protein
MVSRKIRLCWYCFMNMNGHLIDRLSPGELYSHMVDRSRYGKLRTTLKRLEILRSKNEERF